MYELKTKTHFDSAHFLADYQGKCENLHGHRWTVTVIIGVQFLVPEGEQKDMVRDFTDFKGIVRALIAEFDHTFLVEEGTLSEKTIQALTEEGFTLKILPFRTTAENLAKHFFDMLKEAGLPVLEVEVDETPHNCAIYRADHS